MTNMDSSIFHKEKNNESKTMDGRDRCGGHTVCIRNRAGWRHGRRDDRAGSLANFHDLRDQRQHHHGEGTDADAFKTWNGKTSSSNRTFKVAKVANYKIDNGTSGGSVHLETVAARRRAFFRRCKN